MEVLLIEEIDLDDNERGVVGVADGPESAELLIEEYYGPGRYEETERWDTRHLKGEFSLTLKIFKDNIFKEYSVRVFTTWFILNKI